MAIKEEGMTYIKSEPWRDGWERVRTGLPLPDGEEIEVYVRSVRDGTWGMRWTVTDHGNTIGWAKSRDMGDVVRRLAKNRECFTEGAFTAGAGTVGAYVDDEASTRVRFLIGEVVAAILLTTTQAEEERYGED